MRGKNRLAGLFEVILALLDQAHHPRQELAVAVVGVHHRADAVFLGQKVDMLGDRQRAKNAGAHGVGCALAGIEAGTTV